MVAVKDQMVAAKDQIHNLGESIKNNIQSLGETIKGNQIVHNIQVFGDNIQNTVKDNKIVSPLAGGVAPITEKRMAIAISLPLFLVAVLFVRASDKVCANSPSVRKTLA